MKEYFMTVWVTNKKEHQIFIKVGKRVYPIPGKSRIEIEVNQKELEQLQNDNRILVRKI
jgi:hypothetical protein